MKQISLSRSRFHSSVGYRSISPIVFVNMIGVAIHDVDLRMRLEEVQHRVQRIRVVNIVRVEPADNGGSSRGDTFVDRVRMAFIALRGPSKSILVPSQYVERLIAATAVDHNVLQSRYMLIENTLDGAFDVPALIVRRGNDADARSHAIVELPGCEGRGRSSRSV